MNLSGLERDERLFVRHLEDLQRQSAGSPRFTVFLTSRQLMIAEAFVQQRHLENDTMFYGGFSDAARRVLGFFPPHQPPDAALFPVGAITVTYRQEDELNHRQVLGALMGLLITRESIGDIVLSPGQCILLVLRQVEDLILDELRKVGRTGVRCERGVNGEIAVNQQYDHLRGTVASTRIDALIALITGLSREKSGALIKAEQVQLQHVTVTGPAREFQAGNAVTVRGYGKYIVEKIGPPTRKGRLPVDYKKYR